MVFAGDGAGRARRRRDPRASRVLHRRLERRAGRGAPRRGRSAPALTRTWRPPAGRRRSCNNSSMNPSSLRRLGRSDLQVSPLCLGGNVFGWTVDEAPPSACSMPGSTPASTSSTPPTSIRAGCRATGRRIRDHPRQVVAPAAASATRSSSPPRSAWTMGDTGDKGLSAAYIRRAVEARCAASDRQHRPLPGAHRRREDAARGNARHLRRADQGRARSAASALRTTPAARLAEALAISAEHGLPRYETLQPHYNL